MKLTGDLLFTGFARQGPGHVHRLNQAGRVGPPRSGQIEGRAVIGTGADQRQAQGDIDAMFNRLTAHGVHFVSSPSDYPWNARCAYFTDPDDNVWEIYAWYPEEPKHDFDSSETSAN